MLGMFRFWMPVGLLVLGARGSYGGGYHDAPHYTNTSSCSTTAIGHPWPTTVSTVIVSYTTTTPCSSSSAVVTSKTKTIYTTSIKTTQSTVKPTTVKPTTVVTCSTTTSLTTSTITVYPTTKPTITVYPTTKPTITPSPTYPTSTYIPPPPPVGSCAASCNISAGTVNLFFWPTTNTYSYPSTFVDTKLGYTFTSPSVYMIVNTINGYNSASQIVSPTGTSVIFALDLTEVSTIVSGTATVQLSLSDLGTDCPQSAAASEILTMVNSRCDPILAAPSKVSSWAQPCNACGRFGLFDPPYAAPTITGGLIEPTTTTTVPAIPITTATAPVSTPTTTVVAPTTRTTSQASPTTVASTPRTTSVSTPKTTSVPTTTSVTASTTAPASAPAARATANLASILFNLFSVGLIGMI